MTPALPGGVTAVNLGLAALASGSVMRSLAPYAIGLEAAGGVAFLPPGGVPLPPLLAGTLIYYGVNTSMVAVAVALAQGKRPLGVWRDGYLWTAPGFLAGGAVVRLATALAAGLGSGAVLSLLWLYLVYYSYSIYLRKVHQLEDNQQALRRARDELEDRVRERTADLAPAISPYRWKSRSGSGPRRRDSSCCGGWSPHRKRSAVVSPASCTTRWDST